MCESHEAYSSHISLLANVGDRGSLSWEVPRNIAIPPLDPHLLPNEQSLCMQTKNAREAETRAEG